MRSRFQTKAAVLIIIKMTLNTNYTLTSTAYHPSFIFHWNLKALRQSNLYVRP